MSTLVKCPNNHYYDADKYSSCPYCADAELYEPDTYGEATAPIYDAYDESVGMTDALAAAATMYETPEPRNSEDLDKTVGVAVWTGEKGNSMKISEAIEPVVGWLVCKKGPEFGKSYILKAGRNFIGRSDDNDIVIRGDKGISRKGHGVVVYDPKAKRFFVQPGNSSELFYVNDNVVLQVMNLNDRDVISLGETELMFVALCGDDFSWDNMK